MKSVALCVVLVACASLVARAEPDPGAMFARKCSSCHTFGKGVLVGPDLKGVTDRHSRQWLTTWIASSEKTIQSGDPAAIALFKQFKQQRMPDQSFSPAELASLLDYLAAAGPEADARRKNRRADTATPAEIEMGRSLFVGQQPLTGGGASCSSCHRVRETAGTGGTLGPDLTRAYSRFQDKGMASLFARGCFPRGPDAGGRTSMTDRESFALRAFLRQAETNQQAPSVAASWAPK
jgi:cytochrome c2